MCKAVPAIAFAVVALFFAPAAGTPFVSEVAHGPGIVGTNLSMALGPDGKPHIAYWDGGNAWLLYATKENGVWTTEIVEASGFVGLETSIGVDSQGEPHIAYHNFTTGSQVLRYAKRSGGSWTVETADSGFVNVGRYNSIALDANDKAHISYFIDSLTYLGYATNAGGPWNTEFVDASAIFDVGYFTSIAVDPEGRPHIAYVSPISTGTGQLLYAVKQAGGWQYEIIDFCGICDDADLANSMQLDTKGRPHFAYYADKLIVVASMKESGTITYDFAGVLAPGDPGSRVSLALDAEDRFHVTYYDQLNGDLWYAVRADTGWAHETVDITGDVGGYAWLALDGESSPIVAYYDADNFDVKVADARLHLLSPQGGETWPVGASRTVEWSGGGEVDVLLSTDGGNSFDAIAENLASGPVDGRFGGKYELVVPHTPSRFSVVKLERNVPFATARSESLFTIETSISLLSLVVMIPDIVVGNLVSWNTDPGPSDLGGYRLERGSKGAWQTVVAQTLETSYLDTEGKVGDTYRLYGSNRLGEEFYLGEASGGKAPAFSAQLHAWPVPYSGGDLHVTYPTGGVGGVAAPSNVSIYDVSGRLLLELDKGTFDVGIRETRWNGRDTEGRLLPSGVYFIRAVTGGVTQVRKLVIVR